MISKSLIAFTILNETALKSKARFPVKCVPYHHCMGSLCTVCHTKLLLLQRDDCETLRIWMLGAQENQRVHKGPDGASKLTAWGRCENAGLGPSIRKSRDKCYLLLGFCGQWTQTAAFSWCMLNWLMSSFPVLRWLIASRLTTLFQLQMFYNTSVLQYRVSNEMGRQSWMTCENEGDWV
jgi:hypothetical protein